MRVIVCGGRDFGLASHEEQRIHEALNALHNDTPIDMLIYGCATGADEVARLWAKGRAIVHVGFPADWGVMGRRAGPVRNHQMLKRMKPDLVVAFPGGAGTEDMVKKAKAAEVPVIRLE